MSADHRRFHYSATCETFDPAVLPCLRALCYHSLEGVQKRQIGYGGANRKEWKAAGHQATFRFTEPRYRQQFIDEANRLLAGHWTLAGTNEYDRATPQRHA